MTKDSSTTCGMRSKHLVIVIGIVSIMQSLSYITTYVTIFLTAENWRMQQHNGEWVPSDEMFAELISIGGMIVFSGKVLICGILILGAILSSPCCLVVFFITGLIGVVVTVNLGVAGLNVHWTVAISIVILSFSVPDLICVGIVLKACVAMRSSKISGEVVRISPGNRNYPLPTTNIINRPRPPPYFAYYNSPSPVMDSPYTFPPPEISHQYNLPPVEFNRQYGTLRPETPRQLNAGSLEMVTRFTTQPADRNEPPIAYYNPQIQRIDTEELQQSSNDMDDISIEEPPRIYYTPVPPAQVFSQISVQNPQLRPKVNE